MEIHSWGLSKFFIKEHLLYYFSIFKKRMKTKSWNFRRDIVSLCKVSLSLKRLRITGFIHPFDNFTLYVIFGT